LAASGTTNLSNALEQIDVEDEPGESADFIGKGANVVWLL